jgi:hypothetical protein
MPRCEPPGAVRTFEIASQKRSIAFVLMAALAVTPASRRRAKRHRLNVLRQGYSNRRNGLQRSGRRQS